MKTCRMIRDTRLLMLTSVVDTDNGQRKVPAALPLKQTQAPIEQEAAWVPETVWIIRRREKSLVPEII